MFRSATEAGLNDLHVRLLESADLYGHLAEKEAESPLADLLGALANRRRQEAGTIETFIRRQGALPDVPDTDWETLEGLVAGAHQAFGDNRSTIDWILEREKALAEAANSLLNEPVPGDLKRFLERFELEIRNSAKRLEQARGADAGTDQ